MAPCCLSNAPGLLHRRRRNNAHNPLHVMGDVSKRTGDDRQQRDVYGRFYGPASSASGDSDRRQDDGPTSKRRAPSRRVSRGKGKTVSAAAGWRDNLQRCSPGRRTAAGLIKANDVIKFIESFLIIPSGEGAGEPFIVRDWQKEFIYDIYAPLNRYGRRKVRSAVLSMARKNGKTALIAALVLAHLIGPVAVDNGEIYSAANDREQAGQVFKFCEQLVRNSPILTERLGVIASRKRIVSYASGSIYMALSRDAKSKHGYNPTLVIYDELAQAIDRKLYDVLDTSFGARAEGLFIAISTQAVDREQIFSQLVDDGLSKGDETSVCHLYAVPEAVGDIFDPDVWAQANPALGDFRLLADFKRPAKRA